MGIFTSLSSAFLANPVSFITAGIAGITSIAGVIMSRNKKKQEETAQALKESVSQYETAKSNLDSLNSKLDEHTKKRDALQAKGSLTYAEKGELEKLKKITRELELQKDIEEKNVESMSNEVAEKTIEAYGEKYGKHDVSQEEFDQIMENTANSSAIPMPENQYDIANYIAMYTKYKQLLEENEKKIQEARSKGEDVSYLEADSQFYRENIDDIEKIFNTSISEMSEKRQDLQASYDKAIQKQNSNIILEDFDQEAIDSYSQMSDNIKRMYQYYDPDAWNRIEIADILNTDGIETTKEELIKLSKSGQLTPETIESYAKLNQLLKESGLISDNTAQTLCDVVNEWAKAESISSGDYSLTPKFTGFTEEQSKALDDFNSKMQKLGEARLKSQYGDKSGMADLIREFPQLQGKTENLDEAISELVHGSVKDLQKELGQNIPPEVQEQIDATADAATGAAPLLSESFDRIQSSYSAMEEMKSAIASGNLTDSLLSSISALDPVLNDLVSGFHSGAVSANELCQALQNHYNVDLQNYGNALIEKNRYSKDFYQGLVLTDEIGRAHV